MMQHYIELNAHYIGASHVANGWNCEDFSASFANEAVSIAVISDGHGDQNCFRSAEGAQLACEVSIALCVDFQAQTAHIKEIDSEEFQRAIADLKRQIAENWRARVLAKAKADPFTAAELAQVSPEMQAVYSRGEQKERAYGCTLIIAMVTAAYWLALQIGDGECVAAYDNGIFAAPVPKDENCVGNRATSLCDPRASALFHHYVSPIKPVAAFVLSDGVEESFDRAGLYEFLYSVAYWAKEDGHEAAKKQLAELLPKISDGGSSDDVSLSAIIATEGNIAAPKQPLEQVYQKYDACANFMEQCASKTESIKNQLAIRQRKCQKTEAEIAALKETLAARESECQALQKECDELNGVLADLAKKTEQATSQLEKLEQYKQSAETFWFAQFDKLHITRNL